MLSALSIRVWKQTLLDPNEFEAKLGKRAGDVAVTQGNRFTGQGVVGREPRAGKAEPVEIKRQQIEIFAEAERRRRVAKGSADAILMKYEAEAKGVRQLLESKAAGYENLVKSCVGDACAAARLLMIEKIEEIVEKQLQSIKNLKIDKITVWDSAGGGADGKGSSTANFVSSLIRSIPPLQDVAGMAGVELPGYLGRMKEDVAAPKEPPEKT